MELARSGKAAGSDLSAGRNPCSTSLQALFSVSSKAGMLLRSTASVSLYGSDVLSAAHIDEIIERALLEDFGAGDVTSEAILSPEERASATATAKSDQVVCGTSVARAVFRRLDPDVEFEALVQEGERVAPLTPIWRVRGLARPMLAAERPALNLAQRMGGIATLTRRFVERLPKGSKVRITDTRKTTPGLRVLERYAVRVGGGYNHRDNLSSAVLIKDNHIAAAGSVRSAVLKAKAYAPHTMRVEVEVETLDMLDEALAAGADIVMLDNFALEELPAAVERNAGRVLLEVSGNVTEDRVEALALTGIDIISVGALTHSPRAADISLRFELR